MWWYVCGREVLWAGTRANIVTTCSTGMGRSRGPTGAGACATRAACLVRLGAARMDSSRQCDSRAEQDGGGRERAAGDWCGGGTCGGAGGAVGRYKGEWLDGKQHGQGAMDLSNRDRCVRHAMRRWTRNARGKGGARAGKSVAAHLGRWRQTFRRGLLQPSSCVHQAAVTWPCRDFCTSRLRPDAL